MTQDDVFNTPVQEAIRLANELQEVKALLRDIQKRVSQVESRAKRAFPAAFPKKAPRSKSAEAGGAVTDPATMSATELMRIYDEAVVLARSQDLAVARQRIETLGLGDLLLLRSELGIASGKKKMTKRATVDGVMGRVNESVMLTKHTNRQALISEDEARQIGQVGGEAQ